MSCSDVTPARLLAFGDIHGCRSQLRTLLGQVAATEEDELVFLGDYIDRGPDSAGVVDDLLTLRAQGLRCTFLRGNHEQMLLDVLAGGNPAIFLLNGGEQTIASYRARSSWPPPAEHLAFFEQSTAIYETGPFVFAHAGLRPGFPVTRQLPDDLLWIRSDFLNSAYDWGKAIVYGHTPRQDPLLATTRIGLDTGCVYGGRLTCCDVLTLRIWQSDCGC